MKIKFTVIAWLIGLTLLADNQELLQNPSFEQGTGGYWINPAAQGKVDSETSTQGRQSLCLEPTGQKSVTVFQAVPLYPGAVYQLSLDAKAPSGGKIELKLLLQSVKPLGFWSPPNHENTDLTFSPTATWNRKTFTFGPVPGQFHGQAVAKVGIYLQISSNAGPVWLDNLSLTVTGGQEPVKPAIATAAKPKPQPAKTGEKKAPAAKPATAAPSNPDAPRLELPGTVRIYEQAVPVRLVPPKEVSGAKLQLEITDARGKVLQSLSSTTAIETVLTKPGYYGLNGVCQGPRGRAAVTASLVITTPLPPDYYTTPEPAFGVWGGLSPEMLRLGGAKWTRELFFTAFQKADFPAIEPTAEKLKQRSPVKVIRCLNVLHPFRRMEAVPADQWPGLLEKLHKELVSRRGLVDVWETQNEPMVGENFYGAMDDVAAIITRTSAAVRKDAPGTPLAGICLNPMNRNQFIQITGYYRHYPMTRLIDGVMLHPYIPNAASPDTSGYVDTLTRLAHELKTITGQTVPLYISEIGYSTKPGGEVTELQQAAYLAQVVLLNRNIPGLRSCVWHIGLWNDATSQRELDYGILRGHPKNSPVREPKPAFAAWATVSRQTYNAEYRGELDFGRGIRVMLFVRPNNRPLLIAYSLSGRPQRLKIPVGAATLTVTGVCGETTELPVRNGIAELTVDDAPVYLAGGTADDLARLAGLKVAFTPQNLHARPGETIEVTLSGPPLASSEAQLKIEAPDNWQTVITKTDQPSVRRFRVTLPATARPEEKTLFIHLQEQGESRYIWQQMFKVDPPVELQNVQLNVDAAGRPVLSCLPSGQAVSGKIRIRENATQLAEQTFHSGQPWRIPLPPMKYGQKRQYAAEIELPEHYSWQTPLPDLNRFLVARLPSPLPPEQWPAAATFNLADGVYSRHHIDGEYDRPEGKLYLGWNDQYFLITLVYRDRTMIVAPSMDNIWNGDSLQIGFSIAPEAMIRANNDGIQETAYTEFGIMPDRNGLCQARVWNSSNRTVAELGRPPEGLRAGWQHHGELMTYQLEVPWRTLNVKKPTAGLPIKFSLLINDCDQIVNGRYQRHWLEWYSGIADGKEPALYGDGQLAP